MTLGAVAVVAILIGAVLAATAYRRADQRADRLRARVTALESDVAEAQRREASAKRDLTAANARVLNAFRNGHEAAFGLIEDWEPGSWYIVKIGPDELRPEFVEVEEQYDLGDCELTFLKNDSIWTQPNAPNPC